MLCTICLINWNPSLFVFHAHYIILTFMSIIVLLPCMYTCIVTLLAFFLFLWYSGMRVTSKSRTWSTGAKHLVQCIMLSCASFFSGTGFLLGVEHGSVQHRKLECTWPKLCALIGPLHFRLASFILFVVSHVYCALLPVTCEQFLDAKSLLKFLVPAYKRVLAL